MEGFRSTSGKRPAISLCHVPVTGGVRQARWDVVGEDPSPTSAPPSLPPSLTDAGRPPYTPPRWRAACREDIGSGQHPQDQCGKGDHESYVPTRQG